MVLEELKVIYKPWALAERQIGKTGCIGKFLRDKRESKKLGFDNRTTNWQAVLDFSQAPVSTNNYTTNCQITQSSQEEIIWNQKQNYEMRLGLKNPTLKFGNSIRIKILPL